MKKQKIIFIPFELKFNKYVDLMKSTYSSFSEVLPFNIKNFFSCKYFVLNWYESRNSLKFFIFIFLLKIMNKKIIWTMHNKIPHDSKNKFLNNLKMKIMINFSYKIIIHSKISINEIKKINNSKKIENKIIYAPLPNFIGIYGETAVDKTPKDKLKLLFLGLVKPYKNIELLVEVFNELNLENAELLICGFAKDNYKKELLKKVATNKNIEFYLKFIADNEIPKILAEHHILVTPYNSESVLNSASIILAFSYQRSVLSPNNGTLSDFENQNMFFSYEYKNYEKHKKVLKEKILFLYENYADNYNRLLELGKVCFDCVKENNSLKKISDILKSEIK